MLEMSRFTSENARDGTPRESSSFAKNNPARATLTILRPVRERPFTRGLRRVSQACRVHFNFVGTTRGFFLGKIIPRELAGEKSRDGETRARGTAALKNMRMKNSNRLKLIFRANNPDRGAPILEREY